MEKIGAENKMKKFRVEIDGEEFMVKIEELKAEAEVEEKQETKKSKTEKKPVKLEKKTASKSETKTTKEKIVPADLGQEHIVAPMPGSILEIKVSEGDTVNQGDILVVLEAMKMENEITATQAGTVEEIKVQVGDSVDANQILVLVK